MKTNYVKPQIEIMEVDLEEIIATSSYVSITDETEDNIDFRSRRRLGDK